MTFIKPGYTYLWRQLKKEMIKKGSKPYSIINNKCPGCHEGDFFVVNNSFDLKHFSKMHAKCGICDLSFEQEPGYYFGAMYISYAINVVIMVAVWVAFLVLAGDGFSIWWMVLISAFAGLALVPVTFRWARLFWINMFIKYSPVFHSGKKQEN